MGRQSDSLEHPGCRFTAMMWSRYGSGLSSLMEYVVRQGMWGWVRVRLGGGVGGFLDVMGKVG